MKNLVLFLGIVLLVSFGNAEDPRRQDPHKFQSGDGGRQWGGPGDFVSKCASDEVLTAVEVPIYDDEGLFVIGWKTVWMCIPAGLEPAG